MKGNKFECFEQLTPKWITIVISVVWTTIVISLLKPTGLSFYVGLSISLLLFVLTINQKADTSPKLIIDNYSIKTTYGETFQIKSIAKAEVVIKSRWARVKNIYIRLHFKTNDSSEFPVDRLDKRPNEILNEINARINSY